MTTEIACFISPHGFGHATRTIAVLEALHTIVPDLHVRLFTTVPEILFRGFSPPYTYYRVVTDVGLVQTNALKSDTSRTMAFLTELIPFNSDTVGECSRLCKSCSMIICDISVLGVIVGKNLGIRSILIENFTWDWIYSSMADHESAMDDVVDYFAKHYGEADLHIQAEPICRTTACDITCPPIARRFKVPPTEIFRLLGHGGRKIVLISMGGIQYDLPFLSRLAEYPGYFFVLAGQETNRYYSENVRMLAHDTTRHHPDLIRAADLLLCKTGYSTIAECAQSDTPICCVSRRDFPESEPLETFVRDHMHGIILNQKEFSTGTWLEQLPALLKRTRSKQQQNGSWRAAHFIANQL